MYTYTGGDSMNPIVTPTTFNTTDNEIDKQKGQTYEWIKINPQDDSTYPKEQTQVIVSIHDDSGDTPYDYTTSGWHVDKIWIVDNEVNYHVIAWRPFPIPLKIKKEN